MTSSETPKLSIYQVEKTTEEIRQTCLTNIIKMLTERKLLNIADLDVNTKDIIKSHPTDNIYAIPLTSSQSYYVFLSNQKVTAISKQSNINDFLSDHKNSPNI